MINRIKKHYEKVFGSNNGKIYFAPGRVNLIGEHTDYNGGHVFPCALSIGTYLVAEKRMDKKLCFYSENIPMFGVLELNIDDIQYKKEDNWTNYPKGVIKILQNLGHQIDVGLNLYYQGNIPNGAGLSSSASIEVVTAIMLNDLFNLEIDRIKLVQYAQLAENEFVGVNCGIMDQFAIGMGRENHAILLNTQTLEYEYAPLNIKGYKLVVTNTNKRRGLADSKYNERRRECEEALEILQGYIEIESLGDLTIDEFDHLAHHIRDDIIKKRAKHAVYENRRTIKAKKALEEGALSQFGELMNESHKSLRDDYEVTGVELDTLVELAWKEEGVIGSRMTGAGFGGCTITIVKDEYVDGFKKNIKEKYTKKIGYEPTFYVVDVSDGARKLS